MPHDGIPINFSFPPTAAILNAFMAASAQVWIERHLGGVHHLLFNHGIRIGGLRLLISIIIGIHVDGDPRAYYQQQRLGNGASTA